MSSVTLALMLATMAEPPVCGPGARVVFQEGAPVDIFTVENVSARDAREWAIVSLAIDLGPSAGRLVFDTVTGGAGRNVAQPFEARTEPGGARLADLPVIPDGAGAMRLDFAGFAPGQRFRFTIDMDDGLAGWGTRVEGPEIEGAELRVRFAEPGGRMVELAAPFDRRSTALAAEACLS